MLNSYICVTPTPPPPPQKKRKQKQALHKPALQSNSKSTNHRLSFTGTNHC